MINFDKAAQTPILPEVKEAVLEAMDEGYGNPSALYSIGRKAKKKLEECREIIAGTINASPDEIVFTSGATEANNWIQKSFGECITSEIVHHSLFGSYNEIPLDKKNRLTREQIKYFCDIVMPKYFFGDVFSIAIEYINSEIGTVAEVLEIGQELQHRAGLQLYVDTTQAYGHIPIDVKKDGMSFMCTSAQKFGGLAGTGFLYAKNKIICPLQTGGHQEHGFRAGTENLIGIIAMTKAAEIAHTNMKEKRRKVSEIRNRLYGEITNNIPCAHLNGSADWRYRYEGNLNFRFDGYKGEEIQSFLNDFDVLVSTGSACASGSGEPSHVLKAIGLSDDEANSSIRFSFDSDNHIKEVKTVMEVLMAALEALKK